MMDGNTAIVCAVISIAIAVGMGWVWILIGRAIARRRPGLPSPDRSCERDTYTWMDNP